jgi:RHS repeat-associated protein
MELDGTMNALRSYACWLDLSGSEQGAGGVGGLLFATHHAGASAGTYHTTYNGTGNLVSLRNNAGLAMARYEYGPFGETVTSRDALAGVNPFRFSTKYQDAETGLLYYGYRYYSAGMGRWLSRDPIEEGGGFNLFALVGNDSVNELDYLGLEEIDLHHGWPLYLGGDPSQLCIPLDSDKHPDVHKSLSELIEEKYAKRHRVVRGMWEKKYDYHRRVWIKMSDDERYSAIRRSLLAGGVTKKGHD